MNISKITEDWNHADEYLDKKCRDTNDKIDSVISGKQDKLTAGSNITISGNTISATDTNTWRPLGTTAGTACAGNDSRLSDARPANGGTANSAYSAEKSSTMSVQGNSDVLLYSKQSESDSSVVRLHVDGKSTVVNRSDSAYYAENYNVTSSDVANALPSRLCNYLNSCSALSNPDDANENGFYYVSTGSPFSNQDYMIISIMYDGSWGCQIALDFYSNKIAVRNKAGSWNSWQIK